MKKTNKYSILNKYRNSSNCRKQTGLTLVGAMIAGAMLVTGGFIMVSLMDRHFGFIERDAQRQQIRSIYQFTQDNIDCCRIFSDALDVTPNLLDDWTTQNCTEFTNDFSGTDPDYFSATEDSFPIKNSAGNWMFERDGAGPFSGDFYTYLKCQEQGQKHLELFVQSRQTIEDGLTGENIAANLSNFMPGMKFCSDILQLGYEPVCVGEPAAPSAPTDICTDCLQFAPAPANASCPSDISKTHLDTPQFTQECGRTLVSVNLINPGETLPQEARLTMTIPDSLGLEFVTASPAVITTTSSGGFTTVTWDTSAVPPSSISEFTATLKRTTTCSGSTQRIEFKVTGDDNNTNCSAGNTSCLTCNYDPDDEVSCSNRVDQVGSDVSLDFSSIFPAGSTNFRISTDKPVGVVLEPEGTIEANIKQHGTYLTQIYADNAGSVERCTFEWEVPEPCYAENLKEIYLGLPGLAPVLIPMTEECTGTGPCTFTYSNFGSGGFEFNPSDLGFTPGCCFANSPTKFFVQGDLDPVACEMNWQVTSNFSGSNPQTNTYVSSFDSRLEVSADDFTYNGPGTDYDCNFRIGNHANMDISPECSVAGPPPPVDGSGSFVCANRPAGRTQYCPSTDQWFGDQTSCEFICGGPGTCSSCNSACPVAAPGDRENQCINRTTGDLLNSPLNLSLFQTDQACEAACPSNLSQSCGQCANRTSPTCNGGTTEVWRRVIANPFDPYYTSEAACNSANGIGAYCLSFCESITPPTGATLHLEPSTGLTLINGDVSAWADQSSSPITVSQVTTSRRPSFPGFNLNGFSGVQINAANDRLHITNNRDINTTTTNDNQRAYAGVFRTGPNVNNRQVIYEQGGATRGVTLHIESNQIHLVVWNRNNDGANAFYTEVSASVAGIAANTAYAFVGWFDAEANFTGNINLKISGKTLVTTTGVGLLYAHSGGIGLGGINNAARFFDNASANTDNGCVGCNIYEFILYDDTILTNDQRTGLETFFINKYRL